MIFSGKMITVKIVNGAIADDFAGHTRHVYKVKMGK